MKYISLAIFLFLIYSCSSLETKNTERTTTDNTVHLSTALLAPECMQKDTITPMGTKIHYLYKNGKFQISWGDNTYNRTYDSLFDCQYDKKNGTGLWDFVPKFKSESKNNLVFINVWWTSSGGNPDPLEYYALVFPKNMKDSIYKRDFFIDSEGDYLIYADPLLDDPHSFNIHIINLESKKDKIIVLNPRSYSYRSPTLSIQEEKFTKNNFYIKYESLNKYDKIDTIERTIKIEI